MPPSAKVCERVFEKCEKRIDLKKMVDHKIKNYARRYIREGEKWKERKKKECFFRERRN